MRRVLRKIVSGEGDQLYVHLITLLVTQLSGLTDRGDMSSLANPDSVDEIKTKATPK